jgi:hypothetical protein
VFQDETICIAQRLSVHRNMGDPFSTLRFSEGDRDDVVIERGCGVFPLAMRVTIQSIIVSTCNGNSTMCLCRTYRSRALHYARVGRTLCTIVSLLLLHCDFVATRITRRTHVRFRSTV